jgi:hypothetical protein
LVVVMIRTHRVPCQLPRTEADAFNRESGRVYSQTLIWQYRIYRRKGIWLSPSASERLGDFLSSTTLHAHSRDAAQQAFHKACKTAKANRGMGAKYPHKRKFYRATIWKNTGIRVRDKRLLLARARSLSAVSVSLPPDLAQLPPQAFVEMRLVYDRVGRRYQWHLVVDDGLLPTDALGDQTLAADLGEIHPAAVANEEGAVVIFTAQELRALNQYRDKKLSTLQARQSKCTKRSRRWKRLQRRKVYLLARNNRQRRDIEHKVTRAITNHAKAEGASAGGRRCAGHWGPEATARHRPAEGEWLVTRAADRLSQVQAGGGGHRPRMPERSLFQPHLLCMWRAEQSQGPYLSVCLLWLCVPPRRQRCGQSGEQGGVWELWPYSAALHHVSAGIPP